MNSSLLFKLLNPKKVARALRARFEKDPDAFLEKCSGVIHVGANLGQERQLYADLGLDVLWIEPIPEIFRELKARLRDFPRQRAFQYLVTDKEGESYTFHVANNKGASSSIFEFALHRDIWPDIEYERSIQLKSVTLPGIVSRESIDLSAFDALVLDTQGSELLVLKGAASILRNFRYLKTEVADFNSYKGGCTLRELDPFLFEHGFRRMLKRRFAERNGGGSYYDVIYRKTARPDGSHPSILNA